MVLKKKGLVGIGGWLIIPIIGLFLSLLVMLNDLLSINAYYPFSSYIGILSLLDITMIILAVVSLWSIFNKRMYAPKMVICFYLANIVIQTVISFLSSSYAGLGGAWIGGMVWITYFVKSERVKNTFVK